MKAGVNTLVRVSHSKPSSVMESKIFATLDLPGKSPDVHLHLLWVHICLICSPALAPAGLSASASAGEHTLVPDSAAKSGDFDSYIENCLPFILGRLFT